jgi:sec-independent protein translocase protein TatB
MSGIGFGELIILFVIGLIVLGPERLPRVANQLGSWLGQARRMTRVMKRQLEDELDLDKQFEIVPPARTKHASLGFNPPPAAPGLAAPAAGAAAAASADTGAAADEEKDDTYSPAHDADSPGTGVADEVPVDAPADASAKTGPDEPASKITADNIDKKEPV